MKVSSSYSSKIDWAISLIFSCEIEIDEHDCMAYNVPMKAKPAKPIDLREYEEEAVSFDTVIRKLGVKPVQPKAQPKPAKTARKRK